MKKCVVILRIQLEGRDPRFLFLSGKGGILTFTDTKQAISALEKSYAKNNAKSVTNFPFLEAENHLNTFNPSAVEIESIDILRLLIPPIKPIAVQSEAGGMMAMIISNEAEQYWEDGEKLTKDQVVGIAT